MNEIRNRAPVIVIGAGPVGLTCAAYLATAGVAVTVLEAKAEVGGASGGERALGASVSVNVARGALPNPRVLAELDLEGVGLRSHCVDPPVVSTSWLGADPFVLFADPARTLDALRCTHRYDVENYRRYLSAAAAVVDLLDELEAGIDPGSTGRPRLRERRRPAVSTLLKWCRRSASDVLRSFFESDPLRSVGVLAGPVADGRSPDLPGTGPAAAWYARMHRTGGMRAVGGGTAVAEALAARVQMNGGVIRTGATVERIMADNFGVSGVALVGGEVVEGANVVVACDARQAVLHWLRPAPLGAAQLIRRCEAMPVSEGGVARIDAILDGAPHRRADVEAVLTRLGVDESGGAMTMVSPGSSALSSGYRQMRQGSVATRPPMVIAVPSSVDPGLMADDGRHTASIDVCNVPRELAGGWGTSNEPARWLKAAGDSFGQDFRDRVVRWRVTTPGQTGVSAALPNRAVAVVGAVPVSGFARRWVGVSRHSTPVDGLYLCQSDGIASLFSAPAVGRNTASVILRNLGADLPAVA